MIWLCISWVCDWLASLLLQIVMVIVHLPGICLFRSLPLLSLFLLLSIPLSVLLSLSLLLSFKFFISVLTGGFSLKYEWQQVSRTLLSILLDFNYVVFWMMSILPLISSSPSLFSWLLGTLPRAQITVVITNIFMFHNFFNSLARCKLIVCF